MIYEVYHAPIETLLEEIRRDVHITTSDITDILGDPSCYGSDIPARRRLDALLAGLSVTLDDCISESPRISISIRIVGDGHVHLLDVSVVHLERELAHDGVLLRAREGLALARDQDELLEDAAIRGSASVCFLDERPASMTRSAGTFTQRYKATTYQMALR